VSRLFISIYLDEDVSVLIAKLIRSRGLIALTTQESGQLGKTDTEQFTFAIGRQMAVLTHNRADFEELAREYNFAGKNHSGIIIAVRRPPYEIARRVLTIQNKMTADEMDNQVVYI
jgi:predicted nuclease of predicted toxin-antitoxin system